ncbi:hypothetical protein UNDKW_0776 [Undibacterium sp. KW1]|uniref:hypothetical protein n=1 Tax=Undibacterium sp. KW1 TaxID=2058624 RepID=UPI001331D9F8|nr:hypothetical protein [Undibacterium sp. KW1]BBB59049.1 hypothetical protein UNDKW_0776 [Undibacterium sp. KW1]
MITANDSQTLNMRSLEGKSAGQTAHNLPKHLYARRSDFKGQIMEQMDSHSSISAGTGIGMAVGCVLGMINATLAVLISPFFIPGLGLLVTQPMAAALTGAGIGIVCGAVIGALLGWGITSQKFEQLETELESNSKFLTTTNTSDQQRLEAWKAQHGEYANI